MQYQETKRGKEKKSTVFKKSFLKQDSKSWKQNICHTILLLVKFYANTTILPKETSYIDLFSFFSSQTVHIS